MTREEAIKMAKADLKCMERDTSGQDEMCNSHKCDECSLNYERGNMGEQKEWLRLAIKALEQEPRKGHWCPQNDDYFDWYECSECGYGSEGEMQHSSEYDVRTNFCPNCGADMREVEE